MTKLKLDSTKRFSSRVENYIKYRPGYPAAIIDFLGRECLLTPARVIADIGCGTGILSELFLKNGNTVLGVEPNQEMREAGQRLLRGYPYFQSIAATAEATTLKNSSVDMIVAGQAFHWFDHEQTHREFTRILAPGGWVVLIWNNRNTDARPFVRAYENLLREYGTDYDAVSSRHVDEKVIQSFFGLREFKLATFPNEQVFDLDGLTGRLLSSSYAPEMGHPKHAPMIEVLTRIFHKYQANGNVVFEYDTVVYYGQLL
jgi:SAM-dependent methyltransferase